MGQLMSGPHPFGVSRQKVMGILGPIRLGYPGSASDWAFNDIESAGHGCWARIKGTHNAPLFLPGR